MKNLARSVNNRHNNRSVYIKALGALVLNFPQRFWNTVRLRSLLLSHSVRKSLMKTQRVALVVFEWPLKQNSVILPQQCDRFQSSQLVSIRSSEASKLDSLDEGEIIPAAV